MDYIINLLQQNSGIALAVTIAIIVAKHYGIKIPLLDDLLAKLTAPKVVKDASVPVVVPQGEYDEDELIYVESSHHTVDCFQHLKRTLLDNGYTIEAANLDGFLPMLLGGPK